MQNLTEAQRITLAEMEARNAQAIWFELRWWFRGEIREDPEVAERIVAADVFASALYWPL
jgi:hypothetical protein